MRATEPPPGSGASYVNLARAGARCTRNPPGVSALPLIADPAIDGGFPWHVSGLPETQDPAGTYAAAHTLDGGHRMQAAGLFTITLGALSLSKGAKQSPVGR